MPSLIYIADPMCAWCYGFWPQLSALLEGLPGLRLELIVGGLRAYQTQNLDETSQTALRAHWEHVSKTTSLPFSYDVLSRNDFIYNTEPACRAVVTARFLAPDTTIEVLQAIQHGFFTEGLDVTQGDVLARIASTALTQAGVSIDEKSFLGQWAKESTIATTLDDFLQTKRWNVSGFPTLVLEQQGKLDLITAGYAPVEKLVEQLQAVIDEG